MTDWAGGRAQAAAHHDLPLEVPGAIVQFDAQKVSVQVCD